MDKFVDVSEQVNRNVLRALKFLCGDQVKMAMHSSRITEQVKFQMKGLVSEDELDEAVPECLYILSGMGVIERQGLNLFAIGGNFLTGTFLNQTEPIVPIPEQPDVQITCSLDSPSGDLENVGASSPPPKATTASFGMAKKGRIKATKVPKTKLSKVMPLAPLNSTKSVFKKWRPSTLYPYEGQPNMNSLVDSLSTNHIDEHGDSHDCSLADVFVKYPHFELHPIDYKDTSNKTELDLQKLMDQAGAANAIEANGC